MKAGDWVYLGYVERAHGLRGRMVVRLVISGRIAPIGPGEELLVGDVVHRVQKSSVRDLQRLIIQFEDLWSREQADGLRGASIQVPRKSVDPSGGMLPLHALLGLTVRSGELTGRVSEVLDSGPNPQLVVEVPGGSFPVPLGLILAGQVDWGSMTADVVLPEGLQELTP